VFCGTKHIKNIGSSPKSVEWGGESAYDASLQPDEGVGLQVFLFSLAGEL
jgi:hypothetical protein